MRTSMIVLRIRAGRGSHWASGQTPCLHPGTDILRLLHGCCSTLGGSEWERAVIWSTRIARLGTQFQPLQVDGASHFLGDAEWPGQNTVRLWGSIGSPGWRKGFSPALSWVLRSQSVVRHSIVKDLGHVSTSLSCLSIFQAVSASSACACAQTATRNAKFEADVLGSTFQYQSNSADTQKPGMRSGQHP